MDQEFPLPHAMAVVAINSWREVPAMAQCFFTLPEGARTDLFA